MGHAAGVAEGLAVRAVTLRLQRQGWDGRGLFVLLVYLPCFNAAAQHGGGIPQPRAPCASFRLFENRLSSGHLEPRLPVRRSKSMYSHLHACQNKKMRMSMNVLR